MLANAAFAAFFWLPTLPVLAGVALWAWLGGRALAARPSRWRYALFALLGLTPLLFYRFFTPLTALLSGLLPNALGALGKLAAPVGISYFTFRMLMYLYAVYKGKLPAGGPVLVANYVAFFPMLQVGPIQDAESALPQLKSPPDFNADLALAGCGRIVWGMALKTVGADLIAKFVPAPESVTMSMGAALWIGVLLYSLQLYFDFAGYSQMAIGVANTFGYTCGENFKSPYLSRSVSGFWRRWHISLSAMLRQLIYIPLGGSRRGVWRYVLAIVATFAASGLWHGAGLVFLIWGLWHAVCILLGRFTGPARGKVHRALHLREENPLLVMWQILFTFGLVALGWFVFKVGFDWGNSLSDLVNAAATMLTATDWSLGGFKDAAVMLAMDIPSVVQIGVLTAVSLAVDIASVNQGFGAWFAQRKAWFRASFAALCLASVLFFGIMGGGNFIYFKL